jgi:hypothetical protein
LGAGHAGRLTKRWSELPPGVHLHCRWNKTVSAQAALALSERSLSLVSLDEMFHFPIKSLLALIITVEIIVGLTIVAVRWPGIAAVLFLALIGFRVLS